MMNGLSFLNHVQCRHAGRPVLHHNVHIPSHAGAPNLQHPMLITGALFYYIVVYDTQPSTPRLSHVPRLLFAEGENSLVNCLYHFGSNTYVVW